jgi:hypothetical protein
MHFTPILFVLRGLIPKNPLSRGSFRAGLLITFIHFRLDFLPNSPKKRGMEVDLTAFDTSLENVFFYTSVLLKYSIYNKMFLKVIK